MMVADAASILQDFFSCSVFNLAVSQHRIGEAFVKEPEIHIDCRPGIVKLRDSIGDKRLANDAFLLAFREDPLLHVFAEIWHVFP